MNQKYIGWSHWKVKLGNGMETIDVEIKIPEGNYALDELYAKYLARKKTGMKRLGKGCKAWPSYPPSS